MPIALTDDLRRFLVGRFDVLDDDPYADRIRQVGIEAAGFVRHSTDRTCIEAGRMP